MTGVLCTVYGAQVYLAMPHSAIDCESVPQAIEWMLMNLKQLRTTADEAELKQQ